ncbi:hypothetical protein PS847_01904 [Pseudomonas fluorescens]|uniref:Uncharacterized protein n=1 Tax=Pseudomonas fluorescens TaxID=294 RepID=A0A5E7J0G8_PSEFL|nr:hypothetical protein PS847_01904 [Pseudomonas fluorescens]
MFSGIDGVGFSSTSRAWNISGFSVLACCLSSGVEVSSARRKAEAASHSRALGDLIFAKTLPLKRSDTPAPPATRINRKLISNSVRTSATTSARYCGGSIFSQLVNAAR